MPAKIRSIPARDLNVDHVGAWSQILGASGLLESPYLRPEFTQAVGAVRNDVEVAVVEFGDEPVAFLPFRRMPWGGGRPAGGWLANFQALVSRPDVQVDPVALLRACGLRTWRFDQLLLPQKSLTPFIWRSWDAPYADLSDGFEGYCRRLRIGRNRLTELQRQQRKLSKDLGEVRFEAHIGCRDILKTLFEWKGSQYERTGERNIFASSWVCELLDSLLEYQCDELSSMLSVLYTGDRIAAVAYTLRSGPNLHGWFTAFDRELSMYSPGTLLLMEIFRAAESLGIRRVDLGKGPEPYKQRFMTDASRVYEGTIDANAAVAHLRHGWWRTKDWVRSSRLAGTARASLKMLRGVHGWLEMG
jgi:CelD/BcsL family acetyltransferase involved in cellulose biosynthesis